MGRIVFLIQSNTVMAVGIAVILLFLIYRKPKLFFGILFLETFLVVVYYLIMDVADSGSKQKKELFTQREKQSDTH